MGLHHWRAAVERPAKWTIGDHTHDTTVLYRQCRRCGQWQREIAQTGRFEDVGEPYDSEPDLGNPFFD